MSSRFLYVLMTSISLCGLLAMVVIVGATLGLEVSSHSELPALGTLRGVVVTGTPPKPVAGAYVTGILQGGHGSDIKAVADAEGNFEVERGMHPAVLFATTENRALAGVLEIEADDEQVIIAIAPTADYTARLVDKARNPLPSDRKVQFGVNVSSDRQEKRGTFRVGCFGETIQPDAQGRVHLMGLVVGTRYHFMLEGLDGETHYTISTIVPKEPGAHDLGELAAVIPEPYREPTVDERITQGFERPTSALERNQSVKNFARLAYVNALITLADPHHPLVKNLFNCYVESPIATVLSNEYRTMAIPTSVAKRAEALALAKELAVELPADGSPLIVVEGKDGKVLGKLAVTEIIDADDKIDASKLLAFVKDHVVATRLDGRQLLEDALAQAKRENKRVFLQETAAWCGPCGMLSDFLDNSRQLWEQDYLWIKMDARWPQASQIMASYRKGASGGIPWIAILDADGNRLATSNTTEGNNIGHPMSKEEVAHFMTMIQSTAQHMTLDDMAKLKATLEARGGR